MFESFQSSQTFRKKENKTFDESLHCSLNRMNHRMFYFLFCEPFESTGMTRKMFYIDFDEIIKKSLSHAKLFYILYPRVYDMPIKGDLYVSYESGSKYTSIFGALCKRDVWKILKLRNIYRMLPGFSLGIAFGEDVAFCIFPGFAYKYQR